MIPRRYLLGGLALGGSIIAAPMLFAKSARPGAEPGWRLSEAEWKKRLSPLEYRVLREAATDQVVVLSQVLAHPSNVGYEHLVNVQLKACNGEAVRNLKHLVRVLNRPNRHRFTDRRGNILYVFLILLRNEDGGYTSTARSHGLLFQSTDGQYATTQSDFTRHSDIMPHLKLAESAD